METNEITIDQEVIYNFSSPLWDRYFKRTREGVRFPRNYKDVSALDCLSGDCE